MNAIPVHRGDVVIVDFAATNPQAKIRPALVVQNDRDNARMGNTIVVQITKNVTRSHEPSQCLIGPNHPDWIASGLRFPSVVNCSNIGFIRQPHVVRVIGHLSPATMQQIDDGLKAALGLA
ncbi:MAG TPA: type II toxin-antitoxin system PemK/MazF family toxin [Planctomycetaceae bacterium]|nr:type II toxin-antitoxin system PemK/MazF family toxin [Planctomycetaceae bacterium]